MADAPLKLFCNLSVENTEDALVQSFGNATTADPLILTVTDSARAVELHFLTEDASGQNPALPFIEIDPSVAPITAQIAAGKINQPVTGGTWLFVDSNASQTTAAIPYNETEANVQTAIRAACTTNFGSCIVTGNPGGPWTVDRGTNGAYAHQPTGDTTATLPGESVLQVIPTQVGNSSRHDIWVISLLQPPAVLAALSGSYLPAAFVTPASVTAGSAGISALQSLIWNSDAYSGAVAISASIPTGIQITSASIANPSIITTPAHGLTVGQVYTVVITGNTTTGVNATWQATIASATTFSIPYNNTTGGTGGTFAITAPLPPVQYNAQASDILTAFSAHPSALAVAGNIFVTQFGAGSFGISFVGALGGIPIATITAAQTLKVPVGLAGVLNVNTAGVVQILNGSISDVTVDLQINKTEGGATRTIAFRSDCILRPSLIPIGAVSANPLPVLSSISIGSTVTSGASGSVLFVNSSGELAQDSGLTYAGGVLLTQFLTIGNELDFPGGTTLIGDGSGTLELTVDRFIISGRGFLPPAFPKSGLPTPSTDLKGARATCEDATVALASLTIGGSFTGGGSHYIPVFCDGSAWVVG